MTQVLEKLQIRLYKIEQQLEKVRGCSPLTHGWQTQRYAKASRKWDMLAQDKREVLKQIETEEQAIKSGNNMDRMGKIFNKTGSGLPAYWSELSYHETNDL